MIYFAIIMLSVDITRDSQFDISDGRSSVLTESNFMKQMSGTVDVEVDIQIREHFREKKEGSEDEFEKKVQMLKREAIESYDEYIRQVYWKYVLESWKWKQSGAKK